MSSYTNRATVSLINIINEMYAKGIENARLIKASSLLLESGLSPTCISKDIITNSLSKQFDDGGYIGCGDTMFNALFLSHYKDFSNYEERALEWLSKSMNKDGGWGRSPRDISRIPVTGLVLTFYPRLANPQNLNWLERAWEKEQKSLTYKAAYTLSAFSKTGYIPLNKILIKNTIDWLISQQEDNGGFGPWREHPKGPDVICTSIAILGLLSFEAENHKESIIKAYDYLCKTQLDSGIWPYHEIDDGSSWGLYALTKVESFLRLT